MNYLAELWRRLAGPHRHFFGSGSGHWDASYYTCECGLTVDWIEASRHEGIDFPTARERVSASGGSHGSSCQDPLRQPIGWLTRPGATTSGAATAARSEATVSTTTRQRCNRMPPLPCPICGLPPSDQVEHIFSMAAFAEALRAGRVTDDDDL